MLEPTNSHYLRNLLHNYTVHPLEKVTSNQIMVITT